MSHEFSKDIVVDGKIFALLAYVSILCIIPLMLRKNNPFVLAHGKQGLILFIGQVAVWLLSIVIPMILGPFLLVFLFLSICGFIAVLKGQFVRLPMAAAWADKISL